ncbi:hypothetical protein tb265_40670 [Gemmatimonadetes bacterium T265]|nr:hypothetical protein tb265_40670 [Gemmatimonadetes bacterium T265]
MVRFRYVFAATLAAVAALLGAVWVHAPAARPPATLETFTAGPALVALGALTLAFPWYAAARSAALYRRVGGLAGYDALAFATLGCWALAGFGTGVAAAWTGGPRPAPGLPAGWEALAAVPLAALLAGSVRGWRGVALGRGRRAAHAAVAAAGLLVVVVPFARAGDQFWRPVAAQAAALLLLAPVAARRLRGPAPGLLSPGAA